MLFRTPEGGAGQMNEPGEMTFGRHGVLLCRPDHVTRRCLVRAELAASHLQKNR